MESTANLTGLVARRRRDGECVRFVVGTDWMQGRTCYGGLIAALAVQAMRDVASSDWGPTTALRALHTSFVAPVAPGAVDVHVQRLRQGRNLCQVQAKVRQDGQIAAVLLGTYGADRASGLAARLPKQPPALKEAGQLPAPPARPAGAPPFLDHFDMRWAEGPPPFTGGSGYTTCIHLRLKLEETAELPVELQVVLLADLAPTPVIGHLTRPAPNSSVSWALELRPVDTPPPGGWWRADNESVCVDAGYVNHSARLWSPNGQLAAYGSQVVAVFA